VDVHRQRYVVAVVVIEPFGAAFTDRDPLDGYRHVYDLRKRWVCPSGYVEFAEEVESHELE